MIDVNQENFEREVLQSKEPVLVDFWAPWCGPCRRLKPALEAVASQGRKIVLCEVDDNPDLCTKYSVGSIPALLLFKDGQVAKRQVGLVDENGVRNLFD